MKTIAIDGGHNIPTDLGVQYPNDVDFISIDKPWLIEFFENKKVAIHAQEYLTKWGFNVEDFSGHLIREKIPFINSRHAELSVEIHHNYNGSEKFRGAEVIYHPNSKKGKKAAQIMLDAIKEEGFETRGIFEGYYRYDKLKGFFAFTAKLWKPSIIVECGYLSNQTDRNVISYVDYPHDMGLAIAKGVRNYVEKDS